MAPAVLVTGASGFLGGRMAQMLAERGDDVVVLARGTSALGHLRAEMGAGRVRVVRGDLGDLASLRDAFAACGDVRVVFHCAACSTDWAAEETYVRANVTGTRNLLEAAREARGLERFVHVSTTDVYGYPEVPCDEVGPTVGEVAGWLPYCRTKRMGEEAVWEASRTGLPVTVVRPATIYGPRGKDFTVEMSKLLRSRVMATVDGGRATGGFTYVDNVCEAMLLAASTERAEGRAYNLSDGTGASWREYLRMFASELGCKEPWIDLRFGTAMGVARVMEAPFRALPMLPGEPLLTRHAVLLLGREQEFPSARARAELGWVARVGLEEGLRRSAEWLRGGSGSAAQG